MKNRIKHFRNLRGMTLRQLGLMVGFPEKNANVRIAQYETNDRVPKAACIAAIAKAPNVSSNALTVPNVEYTNRLMRLLFVLEDRYGLQIEQGGDSICLRMKEQNEKFYLVLWEWSRQAKLLACGEIDQSTYDQWR
ncbi:MAG: helix-turn-helix transcriptional regulator, partial [Clostridia bacterium]